MERIWLQSYPEGVPADIDANGFGSIGDFIKASIEKFRDRIAFLSMGQAMSYDELDRKSRQFAAYLQNVAGLPRGARVALMMPNLLQDPIAMFGALRAGYVVVNCNPLYSPRELRHQLLELGSGGDRRTGKLRSDTRKGDRRNGDQGCRRHRRGRSTGLPSGADRQFRPASHPARHSRLAAAAGGALQSRPCIGAAASVHGTARPAD